MSSPLPNRRKLATWTALALIGGLALSVMSLPAMAVNDNQGTVKVHEEGELGEEKNNPKVGCPFYVEGFNMEAEDGTVVIKSWPPTGDGTVVIDDTWEADDGEPANHFITGPYTIDDGHYKLFVSDEKHDKHKVFWVECATEDDDDEEPCPEDEIRDDSGACVPIPCLPGEERDDNGDCQQVPCPPGTTRDDSGECVPDTEIPVFPTAAALAVGSIGALAGSMLIFRRRNS